MYKIIVNSLFVIVLGLLSMFGLGALYDRPKNKEPTNESHFIIQKGYIGDSLIRVDTLSLDTIQKPSSLDTIQKPSSLDTIQKPSSLDVNQKPSSYG